MPSVVCGKPYAMTHASIMSLGTTQRTKATQMSNDLCTCRVSPNVASPLLFVLSTGMLEILEIGAKLNIYRADLWKFSIDLEQQGRQASGVVILVHLIARKMEVAAHFCPSQRVPRLVYVCVNDNQENRRLVSDHV